MKQCLILLTCLFTVSALLDAQEIECKVSINVEPLNAQAKENLADFLEQVERYINSHRWLDEDLGGEKIRTSISINFQASPRDNHYIAQVFIGSSRPIYKADRSTAVARIKDDSWEFDYVRFQSLSHNEYRFDPLLSFIDFYMYLIIGYDFDTYKANDGTPYFQKALEIVNRARGAAGAGRGWEINPQSNYTRAQLVDELLNPKFRDLRDALYTYHYNGLDLLYKNPSKARKNILAALEKVGKLQNKINQPSLAIRLFFETKHLEIADTFRNDPDQTVYARLAKIDPSHQATYKEYSQKNR
ncbi:MAG: DUF4835 family protein [Ignavibacteriae bacterium]|nr:DUF4835 family protein [Ignavibacteriota bacterium]